MSPEAVGFGRDHFGSRRNLRLEVIGGLGELESMMDDGAFLVALEVIEHLTNEQLELFKTRLMAKVDGAVFSFPYDQKNIEGTDHLQSFTIFDIFEIFPGFETLFLRRGSIKFIGAWQRQPRAYVRETLKIAGEADSVARICNLGGPREPAPVSQQPASYLARLRALLRR
jgi:hypothetical protein